MALGRKVGRRKDLTFTAGVVWIAFPRNRAEAVHFYPRDRTADALGIGEHVQKAMLDPPLQHLKRSILAVQQASHKNVNI